eukprot:4266360-Prymnesium_polylepis.1
MQLADGAARAVWAGVADETPHPRTWNSSGCLADRAARATCNGGSHRRRVLGFQTSGSTRVDDCAL